MLKSYISLTALVLLLLVSCKAQKINEATNSDSMQLILHDNYGGSEDEEFLVIKDQKSLTEYFGIFNRTRKPGIPVPEIDFAKDMIVIWSPGENNRNSQLKIEISNNKILLLKKIAFEANNLSAITSPVYIYKLPYEAKSIQVE